MIEVFILCRNEAYIERWKRQAEHHENAAIFHYLTGYDSYYRFIHDAIAMAKSDTLIACHDDVWMGKGFFTRAEQLIAELDETIPNWGIAGNAGICIHSQKVYRYIGDPHKNLTRSAYPKAAGSIDGNLMVINKANYLSHKVDFPELKGFHCYDTVLSFACLKAGLLPVLDHRLMVYHESAGNGVEYRKYLKSGEITAYLSSQFINHSLPSINGAIPLTETTNYNYLEAGDTRQDLVTLFDQALAASRAHKKPTLTIYCRTQFKRRNLLTRAIISFATTCHLTEDLLDLSIMIITDQPKAVLKEELDILSQIVPGIPLSGKSYTIRPDRYSRTDLLIHALEDSESDYAWFVDDDDFIYPHAIMDIGRYIAASGRCFIASDCLRQEEIWDTTPGNTNIVPISSKEIHHTISAEIFKCFSGDNYVPICGCIFPVKAMQYQLEGLKAAGDYYEDYFLLMLALSAPGIELVLLPKIIAGISLRENENTVEVADRSHWNYSYATFIGELLDSDKMVSPALWMLASPYYNNKSLNMLPVEHHPRLVQRLMTLGYATIALVKLIRRPDHIMAYVDRGLAIYRRQGLKALVFTMTRFGRG